MPVELRCHSCGRTATRTDWGTASHPTLGSLTQCPDCGSTRVQTSR